ncbi:MAG: AraC family transcriptional regulator [Verrucomicrobia bacterium]|jgi:AraC-like DNA-binding protein|nr:AraC family transcriptional regulator [Verrucomicrobiota bacterium]MBT7068989.1 AraC family transcriptional regulator [Verrucomicrobiota bacterium]MBT7700964.1 AraC family transcriptional regulator [Verrucomicrobiota bacterium]
MPDRPATVAFDDLGFLPVAELLFDALPDVVFFVKDLQAHYVTVNQTLMRRCGCESKQALIGRTAQDLFPGPMGRRYTEEDEAVLRDGSALRDRLQLHLYLQGGPGWCITTKLPLRDADGAIIGLVGVSNDVHMPAEQAGGYRELAKAVRFIQARFADPLRLDGLATLCGLSVYQFEQRMKKLFQLTAGQFINKTRIENACCLLMERATPVADVALACGFSDQSAFTRQFKATTGLTPTEYRRSRP